MYQFLHRMVGAKTVLSLGDYVAPSLSNEAEMVSNVFKQDTPPCGQFRHDRIPSLAHYFNLFGISPGLGNIRTDHLYLHNLRCTFRVLSDCRICCHPLLRALVYLHTGVI